MAWDSNGQMIERGSDDFAWTALGQLRQAAISGETARDYVNDAFGRRVKTVVGSQTNRFLYDGWHMIGEYDSTAGHWLWQEGPWCEGERMLEHVARDTNDLDVDSNTTEYRTYAVHEDFQDTVWGLSDTGAAIVERYFYTDPYGASETKNAAGTNIGAFATNVFHRKRLHGGFIEAVSGLYDFRMRWFGTLYGTWTSRDPRRYLDSLNPYQSFVGLPTAASDQFGASVSQDSPSAVGDDDYWLTWEQEQYRSYMNFGQYVLLGISAKYAKRCLKGYSQAVRRGECPRDPASTNAIRHCSLICAFTRELAKGPFEGDYTKASELALRAGATHEIADFMQATNDNPSGSDVAEALDKWAEDMDANRAGAELASSTTEDCCCACRRKYGCPCKPKGDPDPR